MTRRLAKYVGDRDGRPVFVTTFCPLTGDRRLARYVGDWPASGSGAGRPVFVFGECQTVDPSEGVVVTSECCPGLEIPRTLFMTVERTEGDCTIFDGFGTREIYFRQDWLWPGGLGSAGAGWANATLGSGEWLALLRCRQTGTVNPVFRWDLLLERNNSSVSCRVAVGLTPPPCPLPLCLPFVFNSFSVGGGTFPEAIRCCQFQQTRWQVTVWDPAGTGICSGSGSGFGSGDGEPIPVPNRDLAKFVGLRDGRPVFVQACCPPQSGSGACAVEVACCPGVAVPCEITATISGGGDCGIDTPGTGRVVTMEFGGSSSWFGSFDSDNGNGKVWNLFVWCEPHQADEGPGTPTWYYILSDSAGECTTGVLNMNVDSCDPLELNQTGIIGGDSCDCTDVISLTVTA